MLEFWADLHIHTALSPCASDEMKPQAILNRAIGRGVNLVGITDHNSAKNVLAVIEAARNSSVLVLPGMEVQSREEVHLVCLFQEAAEALEWESVVYDHLPEELNNERYFGAQLIIDSNDLISGKVERLLLTSTCLSVEEIALRVKKLGGICIPAHVDRPAYSLINNLGFVPPGLQVAALEISNHIESVSFRKQYPETRCFNLVSGSDAHWLDAIIDPRTCFRMNELNWQEIQLTLSGAGGREVVVI